MPWWNSMPPMSRYPVTTSTAGSRWAQVWRGKERTDQLVVGIKTDPHSPLAIRGTVPEMNQAAFYEAFGVKEGDKMYLAPEKRVTLW
jgi:putative endopeptidase